MRTDRIVEGIECGLAQAYKATDMLELQHRVRSGTYGSKAVARAFHALNLVFTTVEWLKENDPKVLESIRDALK